jgi:hypothetical protein
LHSRRIATLFGMVYWGVDHGQIFDLRLVLHSSVLCDCFGLICCDVVCGWFALWFGCLTSYLSIGWFGGVWVFALFDWLDPYICAVLHTTSCRMTLVFWSKDSCRLLLMIKRKTAEADLTSPSPSNWSITKRSE